MASVHCWLVRKMASRCCVEYGKQMASGGATTIGDAVHPRGQGGQEGFPDRGRGRVYFAGYDFYQSFVNPKEILKRRELATEDAKAIVPKFILKKRKRE
ncbi:hypothetical protein BHE74_00056600 [Ensete ventricosum]|nr:hypothetical protein BHE74_00056600 [Ensete ventricosum]